MANPTIKETLKQTDYTLSDLLDLVKLDIMEATNAHHLGTVQSFDPTKQTAVVSINYKRTYFQGGVGANPEPKLVNYPLLLDVPVVCLGGGPYSLRLPITKGDECLVLFNDRSIDNWFQSGQVMGLSSPRTHSLADGIALVGVRNSVKPLLNYDSVALELGDVANIRKLRIDTTATKLLFGTTEISAKASKVRVANATTTLNTQLQTLLTEIQSLITQIQALTVTTAGVPSGTPNNGAAFAAIGVQVANTATAIGALLE